MIPFVFCFKSKGEGNILSVLEPGDLAEGFKDNLIHWTALQCREETQNDRASYIAL
jgi:hypothetical protein